MAIANQVSLSPVQGVNGQDGPLDVCICTHNPRPDIFRNVLLALAHQTVKGDRFRVFIIDNASTPPIDKELCDPLLQAGITVSIVQEQLLGNIFARARAYHETSSNWLLFVDDDNELELNYIETGLEIIHNRSDFGCFGGKLRLPGNIHVPSWMMPLLPFLAIRDFGDKEITNIADHWGQWEPVTAGGFIRRDVLGLYAQRVVEDPDTHVLGRKGKRSLNSCEDSLMMSGAFHLGLACSYQPRLVLNHHLRAERFRLFYLLRLMYGFGKSEVMLEYLCRRASTKSGQPGEGLRNMLTGFVNELKNYSWQYAVCMLARRVGIYRQVKRMVGGVR